MEKSYKYRIYPNKKQRELLAKTFGCCRFVYNYFLEKSIVDYKQNNISFGAYNASKDLTLLKKEYEWLKDPDKCALQNVLKDLEFAYKMFFKGKNFPKFKSKKSHRFSYTTSFCNNNIEYKDKKIKLPKLKWVKTKDKRIPQGRILNATISQVPSGKYYVSICCTDVPLEIFPTTNKNIGIDVGLKNFAVTSDGITYDNPKYLKKSLNKLAKLQRGLARKTRGGSNWNKARIKLAKQYEKISNQRFDFLQKLTTRIVLENDIICVEDFRVKDIVQNNNTHMKRSIYDTSWYEFKNNLTYKSRWHGRKLVKVDRYYASSQICHCCGHKFSITKDLSVRTWKCPNCGTMLDRDVNAAINILNEGIKQIA